MSSTDLIIFGMCAGMMLFGIVIIRISRRDRGMGAIAVVLGLIGLVAYLTAEEGAPPPAATTPISTISSTPAPPTPEP